METEDRWTVVDLKQEFCGHILGESRRLHAGMISTGTAAEQRFGKVG
jgi:hypothetical protein